MLHIEGVTMDFGGVVAVNAVDLDAEAGEILGIIGPNGAGKSTLLNVVSGFLKPNRGRVVFEGRDITGVKPHDISRLGIGRTFQDSVLLMGLSCLDNVFIGCNNNYISPVWKRVLRLPSARREEEELKRNCLDILDFMGLGSLAHELAANLPHGYERILGICIGLATRPRLLLVDEPLTGMNQTEAETMVGLLREVRARGTTVIMIDHNMAAVMKLCERIVVLNYGKKIADGSPQEIQGNEEVIEAYLGKD